jgi:hypothetical protein
MNKRDRHGLGIGMDLTPAPEDLACVGLVEPRKNFDERRLASNVLVDRGVDFAGHNCQVDAIQRERAEKRFVRSQISIAGSASVAMPVRLDVLSFGGNGLLPPALRRRRRWGAEAPSWSRSRPSPAP